MNVQFVFNWKSFAAIGASAVGIILARTIDPEQAKEALVAVSDALLGSFTLPE